MTIFHIGFCDRTSVQGGGFVWIVLTLNFSDWIVLQCIYLSHEGGYQFLVCNHLAVQNDPMQK